MTATTNGASLEDCLTNIFSLIDLNGIRWKRFKQKETNNYLYTPIDTHPILTTYAKCIEENHIAVWRNEPQKRHSSTSGPGGGGHAGTGTGPGGGGTGGHSNFPTPTRTSNNNTPTSAGPTGGLNSSISAATTGTTTSGSGNQNNSGNSSGQNNNNYELWIFGYGNQLKVDDVIGDDLVEIEDDTWEQKCLSYECRTLLFKALHNLIDKCLTNKGFTRIGRWFVQPISENLNHSACCHNNHMNNNHLINSLNYSTTLNAHSKPSKHLKTDQTSSINPPTLSCNIRTTASNSNLASTISSAINNYIDNRNDVFDSRQCPDKSDGLRHVSTRSSSSYFTTSLDGTKSSLSFAFSFFVHGDSTVCAAVDVRQHPTVHPLTRFDLATFQAGGIVIVALAPYGLNGILNGVSYKDCDNGAATTTFIQQWSRFHPLPKTMARLVPSNKSSSSSAMSTSSSNFHKNQPPTPNQFNQNTDAQNSRSYLSNLTNMLLPPTSKPPLYFDHEPSEVPPVVEVIVAGHRMRYPSECVFTTSRVVDIYKSQYHPTSSPKMTTPSAQKRPNKCGPPKPNKLSLLSEKLTEDKTEAATAKVKLELVEQNKTQTNFNSPFKSSSSCTEGSDKTNPRLESSTTTNMALTSINPQNAFITESTKDRSNGCTDSDSSTNAPNSNTSGQTTISRYSSAKVGLGSNNTPLGPTDLVKLFPTPPSLEQIILSPSAVNDDNNATKELSPVNDATKDNGIDVYRPVECALMPPPPKWAALTNIIISSSRSLPPECVYKGSSQKTDGKSIINKLCDSTKTSLMNSTKSTNKQLNSLLDKSRSSPAVPSPLTDQTNRTGFNLNPATPKSILSGGPTTNNPSSFSPSSNGPSNTSVISASTPVFSATLPHQRLFNNLNEISSIQLNLMISDSFLGMFHDHNFENCTICVCNMSIKGLYPDAIPKKTEPNHQWRQSISTDNINSPSITGNEHTNVCTCGFSAMTNRHYSHLSGLFFEDELEITNVLYDPTEMIDQNKLFRKIRLSTYSEASLNEEQKTMAKILSIDSSNNPSIKTSDSEGGKIVSSKSIIKDDKSSQTSQTVFEETKVFVIDQLKQQCSSIIHSNSSLTKVLMIESFRNNRHLTSCSNYYAQASGKTSAGSTFHKFLDDAHDFITVKMVNRNPCSLKFSDHCELIKSLVFKLGEQSQQQQQNSRLTSSLLKPHQSTQSTSNLSSIFSRMFSQSRQSMMSKDQQGVNRSSVLAQGLHPIIIPTLAIDPKSALQILEQLKNDPSREALATLNKAILIFSSPIHDWQFLTAPIPENNFGVANLLKIIQPTLDESVGSHNKLYKDFMHQQQQHIFSSRDSPTGAPTQPTPPCQGPLTWRQFHQASGRGTEDQCEPQPIPSLLVSHQVDKNHVALSPFALKFWDKLLLEPYAPGHNMFYLVIAPDSPNTLGTINTFFKELSNTYELHKLGKHVPLGNGLVLASQPASDSSSGDEDCWFSKLGYDEKDSTAGSIMSRLKSYASQLNQDLIKTIIDFIDERQPPYDPHADRFESSPTPHEMKPINPLSARMSQQQNQNQNRPFSNLIGVASTQSNISQAMPQQQGIEPNFGNYTGENQTSLEASNQYIKSQTLINSSIHGPNEDNVYLEDEANKQTGIVVYMIDPFSSPSLSQNLRTLATIGLIKCYSMLIDQLPDNVKRVMQLQLISLDSIVSHSRPLYNISRVDQLKSLSMNVYSRSRKILTNQMTAKSLTGFGPAAALEAFFKTKPQQTGLARIFTPPFILAPTKDKQTELGEMFGDRREKSSVLFCSYCISEDQRWLLASITNDRGEMSESTVINISVIDRIKRPRASVKRMALRKLMEFIVSVMSEWVNPWRLIIGKLGRVGHGELKEWAAILSKRSLLDYSRILTERCHQCSVLPATETVSILSACLVSLEPDSQLRIMPDQFTSDDRQASFNKCPLSTPEDASATHILVFPTSASIQSTHGTGEDILAGSGLDADLLDQFPLDDGIEDLGVEENMDDLFALSWENPNPSNVTDHLSSHHDTLMSSSNLPMGSVSGGDPAGNHDDPLSLLQQPLALGYYMSTAKVGQMPNWFWSTSPHLRNSCPVFLKSALHINVASVQLSDDILHSGVGQTKKSHQLDSNLTTDVLRYVLEGYNSLSWLALNPRTYDRQSCLPVHMQNLLQLYHMMESFS